MHSACWWFNTPPLVSFILRLACIRCSLRFITRRPDSSHGASVLTQSDGLIISAIFIEAYELVDSRDALPPHSTHARHFDYEPNMHLSTTIYDYGFDVYQTFQAAPASSASAQLNIPQFYAFKQTHYEGITPKEEHDIQEINANEFRQRTRPHINLPSWY